jgi:TRAP-type mannitol/chloroaromatic compound transport system permease large subunit
LILKQIPHAVGHDADPAGDMGFLQADGKNTISELISALFDLDPGAMMVGLVSLAVLLAWDRSWLKKSLIPAPLVVVLLGVAANLVLKSAGSSWAIGVSHLVQVPTVAGLGEFLQVLPRPDLKAFGNPAIIMAAITIAMGLFGSARGGPAKVAVFSSGLMGTISGSGVANVVSTGQFTIPLMKRFGYRPAFAGGVEATASMGGQIMPPVMGAVAFIMAETIDVPYADIVQAAIVPAILYYTAAFLADIGRELTIVTENREFAADCEVIHMYVLRKRFAQGDAEVLSSRPYKHAVTVITSTMSSMAPTCSSTLIGVAGLSATPQSAPLARICCNTRCK